MMWRFPWMSNPMFWLRRHDVQPVKKTLVQPAPQAKPKSKEEKSIFTTLKFFVLFSQILGILPQENVNKNMDMHFKWLSWRIFYSLIIIACFSVAVACCFIHWVVHGSSIEAIATGVFYGGSLATMILYFRLAVSWSKLMKSWYSIDKIMNTTYGYPGPLDIKIKIFTMIFLSLGIADYLLSVGNRYEQFYHANGGKISAFMYYNDTFPQLFTYIPFSVGTAIFCTIITIHSNLTWAINDLFIIITSTALAMRFKQISQKLNKESDKHKICVAFNRHIIFISTIAKTLEEKKACSKIFLDVTPAFHKNNSLSFWKEIREDYDRLASFCKELDSYISAIVLLSYFLNIFFLLIQLYRSLKSISLTLGKIYFVFSFGYLIFKTATVSLYAAWINDESKAPTNILNSVDSSFYNVEIRRLLVQISFDKIALTGCKMFCVKRGIILSVASAIVTYELVLIQFSQANLYDTTL